MLYVFYNETTDLDEYVTESTSKAVEFSRDIISSGKGEEITVLMYDCTEDYYYNNHDIKYVRQINVKQFYRRAITTKHVEDFDKIVNHDNQEEAEPVNDISAEVKTIPEDAKQILQHMDSDEQNHAIKYIPDQVLVNELMRRLTEYRNGYDKIVEAMDQMKIFV